VIAGRVGDDAAPLLGRVQASERVVGAAELKGPGALEVLAFEENTAAGLLIDRAGSDDWSAMGDAVEQLGRGFDV
jgi:hypothetical protein